MLLRHIVPLILPFLTLLLADNPRVNDDHGTARVFPLLPPYQGVDFGANFNKLKSSGDAAYFVVRDSIVVSLHQNTDIVVIQCKRTSDGGKHVFEKKKRFRFFPP